MIFVAYIGATDGAESSEAELGDSSAAELGDSSTGMGNDPSFLAIGLEVVL